MPKTLHVHIGLPKAASTTLQLSLISNREILLQSGYSYPVPLGGEKSGNGMMLAHHFLRGTDKAEMYQFFNPGALDFDDVDQFFCESFLTEDCDNVVVSCEGFFRTLPKYGYDFMARHFDAVKIYLVYRPKALWVESRFAQGVKVGEFQDELGASLENGKFDEVLVATNYADIYAFWSSQVGAENVSLMFLGGNFGAIEDQFYEALLGRQVVGLSPGTVNNETLGILTLAAIASVNGGEKDLAQHWDVSRKIIYQAKRLNLTEKKSVLTPRILEFIHERTALEMERFCQLQSQITMSDLQPDLSKRSSSATTFAQVRRTEGYALLKSVMTEKHGINI